MIVDAVGLLPPDKLPTLVVPKPPPVTKPVNVWLSVQTPVTLTVPEMGNWPEELAVVDCVRTAVTVLVVPEMGTLPGKVGTLKVPV